MKNIRRSFQRALALVLAFAMVLTMSSVSQTMEVSAASAKYVKSVKVSKSKVTVTAGKSANVNATVKVSGKASQKVTVKTSNKKVATVKTGKPNKKGVSKITITGKKAGTATITVTTSAKGKKGKKLYKKIKVTVKEAEEQPAPQPQPEPTPQPDPTPQPEPTPTPIQAPAMTNGTVQLSITNGQSSDPSIATVDATGKVTAGSKAGTVTITGKDANGKDVTYTVTVTEADVAAAAKPVEDPSQKPSTDVTDPVTGIILSSTEEELQVGESINLTATPVGGESGITWSSDNEQIAKVDQNGKITAIKANSTPVKITATTVIGGFTQTCFVYVISANAKEINIAPSLKQTAVIGGHTDTVMTGSTAEVTITVTDKRGQVVPNRTLSLYIKEGAGNASYYSCRLKETINSNSNNLTSGELNGITKNGEITTNDNGQATFSLDLMRYSGSSILPNEGIRQSYLITAKTGSFEETFDVNFADIVVPDVTVMGVVPADTALPSDDGVYTSSSTYKSGERDNTINVDYVTSNKVENSVIFSATPIIYIPKSAADSALDKIHITEKLRYVNGQLVSTTNNIISGKYPVYNGEENEKTTTIVELPAGLKNASFHFTKYEISQYTKMKIVFRWAEDGEQIFYNTGDPVIKEIVDTKTDAYPQVQSLENVITGDRTDQRMLAYIILESEGQVNEGTNGGYEYVDVVGEFKEGFSGGYETLELYDAVKWEKVDVSYDKSVENDITVDNIETYIASSSDKDKEFVKEFKAGQYDLSVDVPSYTYSTGNAIFKAVHKNDSSLKYYFAYPSYRDDSSTNKNVNILADPKSKSMWDGDEESGTPIKTAVSLSEQAATKMGVGDPFSYTEENDLIVNSSDAGITGIKVTFASPMFGTIFSGNSSKTVYTSVQWEATKKAEEAIVPEDHYLLKGQIAKIGVKVTDPAKGNNPVQDTTVKLTANELNAPMTAKTNENGETIFTLTDTNAGDGLVYTLTNIKVEETVEGNIEETVDDHNIEFYIIKPNNKKETIKNAVNLYWVVAGIYFKDEVDSANPAITHYVADTNIAGPALKRTVGETWTTGFRIVGNVDEFSGYAVTNIDGLHIGFKKDGDIDPEASEVAVENQITLTRKEAGDSYLTSFFKEVNPEELSFEFTLQSLIDPDVIITKPSVGHGSPNLPASLKLQISWVAKTSDVRYAIIAPNGVNYSTSATETDRELYITAKDEYGNPCATKVYYYVNGTAYILNGQDYKVTAEPLEIPESGIAKITLPAFEQVGAVNVIVKIQASASNNKAEKAMSVYEAAKIPDFELVSAKLVRDVVKVTFSQSIDSEIYNAEYFKKLFTVKGEGATTSYTIDSAKISSGTNERVVDLKLNAIPNDAKLVVSVDPYADSVTGITYRLSSATGRVVGGTGQALLTIEKDASYSVVATKEGNVLKVQIKSGNTVITDIGEGKIFLVDTNSGDDIILPRNFAVLTQANLNGEYYVTDSLDSEPKNITAYYMSENSGGVIK